MDSCITVSNCHESVVSQGLLTRVNNNEGRTDPGANLLLLGAHGGPSNPSSLPHWPSIGSHLAATIRRASDVRWEGEICNVVPTLGAQNSITEANSGQTHAIGMEPHH